MNRRILLLMVVAASILFALAVVGVIRDDVPLTDTRTFTTSSTPSVGFPPFEPLASWTRYADPAGRVSFGVPPGYRVVVEDTKFRLMPADGALRDRPAVTIYLEEKNTVRFSADPDAPAEFVPRLIATVSLGLPAGEAPPSAPTPSSVPAPAPAPIITETPIINPPPSAPPPPTDVVGYLCTLPNRSDANPDGTKRDKVFRSTDGRFYWRSGPDIWLYYDAAARFVALCPWDDWCNTTLPGLTFSTTDLCARR